MLAGDDDWVEEAGEESFPASDPPSWTLGAGTREEPPPPPGMLSAPAALAITSASWAGAPAAAPLLRGRALVEVARSGRVLAVSGTVAALGAVAALAARRGRLAVLLGLAAPTLLGAGLFRRLGRLARALPPAPARAR